MKHAFDITKDTFDSLIMVIGGCMQILVDKINKMSNVKTSYSQILQGTNKRVVKSDIEKGGAIRREPC